MKKYDRFGNQGGRVTIDERVTHFDKATNRVLSVNPVISTGLISRAKGHARPENVIDFPRVTQGMRMSRLYQRQNAIYSAGELRSLVSITNRVVAAGGKRETTFKQIGGAAGSVRSRFVVVD